jgi:hypothetical protein
MSSGTQSQSSGTQSQLTSANGGSAVREASLGNHGQSQRRGNRIRLIDRLVPNITIRALTVAGWQFLGKHNTGSPATA